MIRHTLIVPGNDCIYGVCRAKGCPGKRPLGDGRSHGISGESWLYIVRRGGPFATLSDGVGPALSLEVMTDIFPDTVPPEHGSSYRRIVGESLAERRRGADISLHLSEEPRDSRDFMFYRESCIALAGAPCWVRDTSSLQAEAFFKAHGDPAQSMQGESFWAAMEAEFTKWIEKERS